MIAYKLLKVLFLSIGIVVVLSLLSVILLLVIILIASIGLIVSIVILVSILILVVILGSSLSCPIWLMCLLSWGLGSSLSYWLWILLFRRVISFLSYDENIFITTVVVERSRKRINDWFVFIETNLSVIFSLIFLMFNGISRSILLWLIFSDDKAFVFKTNLGPWKCVWLCFIVCLRVLLVWSILFYLRVVQDCSVGVCDIWLMVHLILVSVSFTARAYVVRFLWESLLFPLQSAVIFFLLWDRSDVIRVWGTIWVSIYFLVVIWIYRDISFQSC